MTSTRWSKFFPPKRPVFAILTVFSEKTMAALAVPAIPVAVFAIVYDLNVPSAADGGIASLLPVDHEDAELVDSTSINA
jgi:hypothetical protein